MNIISGLFGAGAAQGTAQAQLSSQSVQQAQATALAAPTSAELINQNAQFGIQQQTLAQQEALLGAVDPALMSAGQQALAILQGQNAPTLAPLEAELNLQRSNLTQSLASQLGPGGITSSAGQSALQSFDTGAANTLAQQQQAYLSTLLGSAQSTYGSTNPLNTVSSLQNSLAGMQNQQGMQIGALTGSSVTPYAGAPYAGSATLGSIVPGLLGSGATGAGAALGNSLAKGGTTSTAAPAAAA